MPAAHLPRHARGRVRAGAWNGAYLVRGRALPPGQARDWEQFFKAVSTIDVELRVTRLAVTGSTAVAGLDGVYIFDNPSTHRLQREDVRFVARLRREPGGWQIESVE